MLALPGDGSRRSHRRSTHLLPREKHELELNNLDLGILGEYSSARQPWEDTLVCRIREMPVKEQSLALDTICHCLEYHSQVLAISRVPTFHGKVLEGVREYFSLLVDRVCPQLWGTQKVSVTDASMQNLLESLNLDPQAVDKAFLFHLYGLILRECPSMEQVVCHLQSLLELSHQHSSQREGMALAVGLASVKHLEDVWALLEHLGRTKFLRAVLMSSDNQSSESNLHWRWISSTSLLCYGQIAIHAKQQVLPWVDNIASRMVYYFSCSPCDDILKTSFLSAAVLLIRALREESDAPTYKFTQIPELIQCLLKILQKEPNSLVTLFRQKIMLIIVSLSNLRPSLKPLLKSQILKTCLRSVYTLAPIEDLQGDLPLLEPVPDVKVLYEKTVEALDLILQNFISENPSMDEVCFLLQHTEYWLKSVKSHERTRAVQSIFLLLQYVVDSLKLAEESVPSMLGRQIGLLTLLWRDKDETTRQQSFCCVSLLLQLATPKGKKVESTLRNKMKHLETKKPTAWELKLYRVVKAFHANLTVAQHTQLVLTLLHTLGSHSHTYCSLAAQLLLLICEVPGIRKEQVAEILQSLFRELPSIRFDNVHQTMQKAITALGVQHSQEMVEGLLLLCPASERKVMLLWKALATNFHLARETMILLYMKLKLRPSVEFIRTSYGGQLESLMALDTIYELLYTTEYRETVRWAFSGILLGLLTQLHYLLELGLVEGIDNYQEDILDSKPLGPCRTCLEALKGLLWTNNYWEVFAYVKLLQGWELLENLETYPKGVALLARAMAHYSCEVKAVLGQAIISLKRAEERENIVAIFTITEFLNSPKVSKYVSRKAIASSLNLGLRSSNHLVRAMSLKGLSSALMHPKKVGLLQNQLLELLENFLKPQPKDLVGLMKVLGDVLRRLSIRDIGPLSVKIAQHLLHLFKDERAQVRGGAIFLFGDVIYLGGHKFRQALKTVASKAVAPLFFHMADPFPEVVKKAKFTFLRCAIMLKWEFRKELFSKLAWGQGLGAENDIFIFTVESSFGNYQQFLKEALTYLDSPHKTLKLAAMKFIGGMLQDYFSDLCFYLNKGDVNSLKKHLETLSQEPDMTSRRFFLSSWEDVIELYHYVR